MITPIHIVSGALTLAAVGGHVAATTPQPVETAQASAPSACSSPSPVNVTVTVNNGPGGLRTIVEHVSGATRGHHRGHHRHHRH